MQGNSFQTEILGSTIGVETVNYDVIMVPNDGTSATDTIHGAGCLDVSVFAPTAGTSVTSLVVTTVSLTAALENGLYLYAPSSTPACKLVDQTAPADCLRTKPRSQQPCSHPPLPLPITSVLCGTKRGAAQQAWLCRDQTQLVTVAGSNQTNQNITGSVTLDPATLYNLLLLGPVNGPDTGSTSVQLNFTIYPVGAPGTLKGAVGSWIWGLGP